jgi:hypothetical protein
VAEYRPRWEGGARRCKAVSKGSGGDDAVRGGGELWRVVMLLVDLPVPVVLGRGLSQNFPMEVGRPRCKLGAHGEGSILCFHYIRAPIIFFKSELLILDLTIEIHLR